MAAAPYTLAQLLSAQSADQIRARHLALLGADPFPGLAGNLNHGFPVADWLSNPKGMELAYANMFSRGLYDLVASKLPADIASGFLAKAKGDLLTFHASLFYLVERNPATKTTFNMDVSSVVSAPPYDFDIGDVQVRGPSGSIYVSTAAGHLEPGGKIALPFEAELKGSGANDDPKPNPPTLVTAFAGVSVSPSVGAFSAVYHQGTGTGSLILTPTFADIPPAAATYRFRIDVSGDPGVAQYSLSLDGVVWYARGTLVAQDAGNELLFKTRAVAGTGSPTSFVAGDIYTVTSPGSTGFVQGDNEEGDASLIRRARARWPSISLNQTSDVFRLWTFLAYPAANRVSVRADPFAPGRANIVVADSHGGIDPTVAASIASFIDPKLGDVLERVSIAGATSKLLTIAGSVTVTSATASAIQQTAFNDWIAYLATVDIGGVVILAELEQLIMDAGAVDVTGLTIGGAAVNYQLGSDEVPIAGNAASELTWVYT